MKKSAFVLLALIMLAPAASYAWVEPGKTMPDHYAYVGIAAEYAFENFRMDDPYHLELEANNTFGVNPRVGYCFNKYLAAEINYHYMPNFSLEGKIIPGVSHGELKLENAVHLYMGAFKIFPGLDKDLYKPYVILGGGYMTGENQFTMVKESKQAPGGEGDWNTSDRGDAGIQAGLGIELFPGNDFSLQFETNYFWGLGRMDMVEMLNLSVGISFRL